MSKNTDLDQTRLNEEATKLRVLASFATDVKLLLESHARSQLHPDIGNAMDLIQQASDMLIDAATDLER